MRNANTKDGRKKLDPGTIRLIRMTSGLAARIADVAGFDASFVSKILSGAKKPTERFFDALIEAVMQISSERNAAAIKAKYARR